jgi:hypothetical protein
MEHKTFTEFFRKLWTGRSWPRTNVVSKTLNPNWINEKISLSLKDCEVGADQMVFIAAIDHDPVSISKDICLGVVASTCRSWYRLRKNIWRRSSPSTARYLYGIDAGKLEFQLRVKRTILPRGQRMLSRVRSSRRLSKPNFSVSHRMLDENIRHEPEAGEEE